jgi:small subunit ribosomal protein S1
MTSFGAFVELTEGIEGLIHVSEFDAENGEEKVSLEVEQSYPMKVIKLSPSERKVGLSIRALKDDTYRADWGQYISEASSTGGATLGDHFKQKQ